MKGKKKFITAGIVGLLLILSGMQVNAKDHSWVEEGVSFTFVGIDQESIENGWYTANAIAHASDYNATYTDRVYYDIVKSNIKSLNYLVTSVHSTSEGISFTAKETIIETYEWNVSRYFNDVVYANNSLQENYTSYYLDDGWYPFEKSDETRLNFNENGNLMTFYTNTTYMGSLDPIWYLSYIPYIRYPPHHGNVSFSEIYMVTEPDLLQIVDALEMPNVTTATRTLEINDHVQNVTLEIYSANVMFQSNVKIEYYLNMDVTNNSLLTVNQLIMNGSANVYFNYSYKIVYDNNTGMLILADWHLENVITDIFISGNAIPHELMIDTFPKDNYTLVISGYAPHIETIFHLELTDHSVLYNTTDDNSISEPILNIPGMNFESAMFTITGILILLLMVRKRRKNL